MGSRRQALRHLLGSEGIYFFRVWFAVAGATRKLGRVAAKILRLVVPEAGMDATRQHGAPSFVLVARATLWLAFCARRLFVTGYFALATKPNKSLHRSAGNLFLNFIGRARVEFDRRAR